MENKPILVDPVKRKLLIWLEDQAHLRKQKGLDKARREFEGHARILQTENRIDDNVTMLLEEEISRLEDLLLQVKKLE